MSAVRAHRWNRPRAFSGEVGLTRRFWDKVLLGNGCWEWTGAHLKDGYSRFKVDGRTVLAHRCAYELAVGPIPDGLTLDHLCRNRGCVNPAHLEPVTQRENTMRSPVAAAALNVAKTHCINGHAFVGENLRLRIRGGRDCRICHRMYQQAFRQRANEKSS
jgi:hypothetical protein